MKKRRRSSVVSPPFNNNPISYLCEKRTFKRHTRVGRNNNTSNSFFFPFINAVAYARHKSISKHSRRFEKYFEQKITGAMQHKLCTNRWIVNRMRAKQIVTRMRTDKTEMNVEKEKDIFRFSMRHSRGILAQFRQIYSFQRIHLRRQGVP